MAVIGVNRGTKHLNRFLECSKVSYGNYIDRRVQDIS